MSEWSASRTIYVCGTCSNIFDTLAEWVADQNSHLAEDDETYMRVRDTMPMTDAEWEPFARAIGIEPTIDEGKNMPTIELSYLKVGDPAPLPDMIIRIHDDAGDWSAIVVEKGMVSGEPSVTLVIKTREGAVLAETSLLAFLAAARGLQAMAETNFGWEYPP